MAILTSKDIITKYSSVISDHIKSGYVISPFTPTGSFSHTYSYTDLIMPNDNSHILRVWLTNDYVTVDSSSSHSLSSVIRVGILVKKYKKGDTYSGKFYSRNTLWYDSGEPVYEKYFFDFNSGWANIPVFTESLEEAADVINKRRKRLRMSSSEDKNYKDVEISKLPDKFIDRFMSRVNSIRGFKRADATCIKKVFFYKRDDINNKPRLRARVEVEFNSGWALINIQ